MEKKIEKYIKMKTYIMNKILSNNVLDNNKYKIKFIENDLMGIYINKKLLIAGQYIFYGIYQTQTKLWIWASSIPGINKATIKNIIKIKKLNYLFENESSEISNFYYQFLTQEVLYINDLKMLKLINNLLLFLSNAEYNFNPTNSDLNIQFLFLLNIKEKYI